ncbi:MAG: N-acetylmuramic acid 6-phosphate etherase [Verrucomicrobiae bacterium]|nr:N-acetylmuramic acid 6-phosphate etherase [Verrucomicrobiae bacterium]
MRHSPGTGQRGLLGIDAGGTKTAAVWLDADGTSAPPRAFGPANLQAISEAALIRLLRDIAAVHPPPRAVGIGMAGTRTSADRERLRRAAHRAWPGVPCLATDDLEPALAAADMDAPPNRLCLPRVLVLAGTGSCCLGRTPSGDSAKAGGWGPMLGDQGSAYALALDALRSLVRHAELNGRWGQLGPHLLATLHLNEPDALIPWIRDASRAQVAALAPAILHAAVRRDPVVRAVIERAARDLADTALACARRLVGRPAPVRFVLAGGLLRHPSSLTRRLTALLRSDWPGALIESLRRSAAEGAAALAAQLPPLETVASMPSPGTPRFDASQPVPPDTCHLLPVALQPSPTEACHPESTHLDRMPLSQAIERMLADDARIPSSLLARRPAIERAIRLIVRAFRQGGRLLYVGAGTSGRLGVLDASECPPTFGTPPEQVQAIIAGGPDAVFRSREGAEDDLPAGARALAHRDVGPRDVVVGIAASGRTPFVWGALHEARRRGAPTVLICFQPHLRFRPGTRPTVVIDPSVGPEFLTGSTRLKAGTATKLLLNLFTTLAMARMGKVCGNWMIDLRPSNRKLRDRAVRIACALTDATEPAARAALAAARWNLPRAIARLAPTRSHRS